jgi:hypothetical protein
MARGPTADFQQFGASCSMSDWMTTAGHGDVVKIPAEGAD